MYFFLLHIRFFKEQVITIITLVLPIISTCIAVVDSGTSGIGRCVLKVYIVRVICVCVCMQYVRMYVCVFQLQSLQVYAYMYACVNVHFTYHSLLCVDEFIYECMGYIKNCGCNILSIYMYALMFILRNSCGILRHRD